MFVSVYVRACVCACMCVVFIPEDNSSASRLV